MGFFSRTVEERRELIIHGSTLRTMLILSLPMFMMSLVQAFVPVMDGLFVNRFSSIEVADAVGFSTPIIMFFYALSMGISIASSALLGQINGSGNKSQLCYVASQVMKLTIYASLSVMVLPVIGAQIFKNIVDASFSTEFVRYLSLYSVALPSFFISGVFSAVMNSTGKPERSFAMVGLFFVLKLLFNAIFLAYLRLDEYGAAAASFIAGSITAVCMVRELYFKKNRDLKLGFRGLKLDNEVLKTLLRLGLPTVISSSMITMGFILINVEVSSFGPTVMNAQTIAVSINAICFTVPTAISATITTMVSMYVGANHTDKAKQTLRYGIIISLLLSGVIFAIFIPYGEFWVRLFRDDKEIVETAVRALFLYTLSVPFFAIFSDVQAVFIAIGRTRQTMVFGVLRIWLFRIVFMKIMLEQMGVDAIFMGNLFANGLASILFYILLMFTPWKSVIRNRDGLGKNALVGDDSEWLGCSH
ncbi:MAG: MATE family efflux transporter [Bradymonadia bacterium]|jgi:putative MATE family efflux protein